LGDPYQKWDPRDTKTAIGCGSYKGYGKMIHDTFAGIVPPDVRQSRRSSRLCL
jgi:hypothetical protein